MAADLPRNRSAGPTGRTYLGPDGEQWPSVTTITGLVPGKAQILAAWRAKVGPEAADETMNAALFRGTNIHAALDGDIETASHYPVAVAEVGSWLARHTCGAGRRELTVASTTGRYAGTLDLLTRGTDGRRMVVDYKTGRSVYPDYALQLAAYLRADLELGPDGQWIPLQDPAGDGSLGAGAPPTEDVPGVGVILHVGRDDRVKAYLARTDEATYQCFLGLRAGWEWNRLRAGALLVDRGRR